MTLVKPKTRPRKAKKTAQDETLEEKKKEQERSHANQEQVNEKPKITNAPDDDIVEDSDTESVDPI